MPNFKIDVNNSFNLRRFFVVQGIQIGFQICANFIYALKTHECMNGHPQLLRAPMAYRNGTAYTFRSPFLIS